MKPLLSSILVLAMPFAAVADEALYRYEGEVHPLDPTAGWLEFDPCDPPCSDFIEDGHFVRLWKVAGDPTNYHLWIAVPPVAPPPTLWVEWRFRSNFPLGPILVGCDASFFVRYKSISRGVDLYGDSIITFSSDGFVLGLELNEFHTFRFESLDGINYSWSVDGDRFVTGIGNSVDNGGNYVQMRGLGGCTNDSFPNMRNEFDYVRYGTIAAGEQIVATDPAQGFLDPAIYGNMDRFTITFDAPNYVYLDEISVTTTGGVDPPVILQTHRGENFGVDTIEIVLDRPLPPDQETRFTFNDGTIANEVVYTFIQPPPIPTTSSWGLIALALVILVSGKIALRARAPTPP